MLKLGKSIKVFFLFKRNCWLDINVLKTLNAFSSKTYFFLIGKRSLWLSYYTIDVISLRAWAYTSHA